MRQTLWLLAGLVTFSFSMLAPVFSSTEKAHFIRNELKIKIHNVAGANALVPGSAGKVILSRGSFSREAPTHEGVAVFNDVPPGKYDIRVEVLSSSLAFENPFEYWGSIGNVQLSPETQELVFERHMPYITGVKTFNGERFAHFASRETGVPVIIQLHLENPGPEDQNMEVLLKLTAHDADTVYLLQQSAIARAGEAQELLFSFTPTHAGNYLFAPALKLLDEPSLYTDSWDWGSQPLFSVVQQYRKLEFGGYQWYVKSGFGNPGPNLWSDHASHVWVDENDQLTLSLTPAEHGWLATELISEDYFGYGTYTFYLKSDMTLYDPHMVAALFLYKNGENEIDIEFTRWGDSENEHAGNYVIQPSDIPGNHYTFPIQMSGTYSTHRITWQADRILFQSWHGHHSFPSPPHMIAEWEYTGDQVPEDHQLRLHLNFWLFRGYQPEHAEQQHFVISRFSYSPALAADE